MGVSHGEFGAAAAVQNMVRFSVGFLQIIYIYILNVILKNYICTLKNNVENAR